jgi:hypothetical protein
MRLLKYQDRGYKIGKSDLLRIGLALQNVEMNSWEDLAAAIGGQYGEKAKIETDKPFSIEAAMDLFKDIEMETIQTDNREAMPGNAWDLLIKIGVDEETLKFLEIEEPGKYFGGW